jgi:hypothetical protein
MKIFYVLHIREKELADCVDAIRFICNPSEKQRAHLTVRGPYRRRINVTAMSRRIAGDTVSINNVGNFFAFGQNTVFFQCSANELKHVWNKPHFPFNPHISLYDGPSREFAGKLFDVTRKYIYCLHFRAEELEPIESHKGQKSLALALSFDSSLVYRITGEEISAALASQLSEERRLAIVDQFCRYLSMAQFAMPRSKSDKLQPATR